MRFHALGTTFRGIAMHADSEKHHSTSIISRGFLFVGRPNNQKQGCLTSGEPLDRSICVDVAILGTPPPLTVLKVLRCS
jgi:hypothetical protein